MLEAAAVEEARSAVLDAADFVEHRNGSGYMGLVMAATHARDVARAVAAESSAARSRELADVCAAHCEALEARSGYYYERACGAIVCAWDAIDAAAEGCGQMGDATTDAGVAAIQSQLSPVLSPADLQAIINSYTGLNVAQQGSIIGIGNALLTGQTPTLAMAAPLIAGGLALTGVGAPIVAVVGAAVALLPQLLQVLGIVQGPPNCSWAINQVCFTGTIPYGPVDPTTGAPNPAWMTWERWAKYNASGTSVGGQLVKGALADAFPLYEMTIGCEIPILDAVLAPFQRTPVIAKKGGVTSGRQGSIFGVAGGPPSPYTAGPIPVPGTTNVILFLRTFYGAWQKNAEAALNGHRFSTDAALFAKFVDSWNETHASDRQYTFQPATTTIGKMMLGAQAGPDATVCTRGRSPNPMPDLTDPSVPTYVSLLLAGEVDGHAWSPITINIGDAHAPAPPPPAAATGTSSGAGTALVVGGAAAGVAYAGWTGLLGQAVSTALHALVGRR